MQLCAAVKVPFIIELNCRTVYSCRGNRRCASAKQVLWDMSRADMTWPSWDIVYAGTALGPAEDVCLEVLGNPFNVWSE